MLPVAVASKPLVPADPVAVQLGVPSAGSKVSATVASVTSEGPALLPTILYVRPTPGVYLADPSVLLLPSFPADPCVSMSFPLSLHDALPISAEATVAVLVSGPVFAELTAVTVTV